MCECITKIDAKLAPDHKLEIAIMFVANTLVARPYLRILRTDTGKQEARRGKARMFAATFCPFCGDRYEPEPAMPAVAGEKAA